MDSKQNLEQAVEQVVGTTPTVSATPNAAAGKASQNDNVVFQDKPKKNTGMILGMVVLGILAIGGVGFGIWAMMDGNARVDELNKQIKASKVQDNDLLNKIKVLEEYEEGVDKSVEIDVTENANIDTDTDASNNAETGVNMDTADYIYAGKWGLKIKVPTKLKEVDYALLYRSDDFSTLCVSGITSEASGSYKFASLYENFPGLGCVHRAPSDYTSKDCSSIFSIGNHNFCVMSSSLSKYSQSEEDIKIEKESMKLVVDMLSNSENYSEI